MAEITIILTQILLNFFDVECLGLITFQLNSSIKMLIIVLSLYDLLTFNLQLPI